LQLVLGLSARGEGVDGHDEHSGGADLNLPPILASEITSAIHGALSTPRERITRRREKGLTADSSRQQEVYAS
jgi:hypothetical protein